MTGVTTLVRPYSRKEILLDAVVHGIGLAAAGIGSAILIGDVLDAGDPLVMAAACVYVAGLLAMVACSAAYNVAPASPLRDRLRRLDQAAIFLMIAGTYTPFALFGVGGTRGWILLGFVALVALAGAAIKLFHPKGLGRMFAVLLYLVLGWCGLVAADALVAGLAPPTLALLAGGGILYTVGVAFHLWDSLRYQNVVWHGFVMTAAICHFFAVRSLLLG